MNVELKLMMPEQCRQRECTSLISLNKMTINEQETIGRINFILVNNAWWKKIYTITPGILIRLTNDEPHPKVWLTNLHMDHQNI